MKTRHYGFHFKTENKLSFREMKKKALKIFGSKKNSPVRKQIYIWVIYVICII